MYHRPARCGQNAELFNVKPGGTCGYQWTSNG